MAIVGAWTSPKIFYGALGLAANLKEFTLTPGAEMLDSSCFGNTTKVYAPGLKSVSCTASGLVDLTDDGQEELTYGYIGLSNVPVSLFPTNTPTEMSPAYFFASSGATYSIGGTHGENLRFNFTAQCSHSYGLQRGYVLEPGTTARTATGNGTGAVTPGAVGAAQYLYAVLHVVSASAGDTLDVIIESDDNGSFTSATTRVTFTQATDETYQYVTRVAGAIADTYWRAKWTIGGVDPSFTFAVAMAIA